VNRGGLLAHRPALLRAQPAAATTLAAGIPNDEVAVLAQIVQRQFSPKLMECMPGVCGGDEAQPHQLIPHEALRHLRADCQINLAL